jgi:hypothetical protein
MIVKYELERMCKAVVVDYFNGLGSYESLKSFRYNIYMELSELELPSSDIRLGTVAIPTVNLLT